MTFARNYPVGDLKRFFYGKEAVLLAILYGSFSSGIHGPDSDVDIALASEHILSMEERIGYAAELSVLLGREIDLVDLRTAEGLFLHRVMTTGHRVAERKPEGRRLYESLQRKSLDFNADYYPILKRDRDRLLERSFKHKEG